MLYGVVALAFAFVTGTNDGATMIAINLANPAIRPPLAIALLVLAVVAVPLLGGTVVAETFAYGLVSFAGERDAGFFMAAAAGALAIVLLLSRLGLPTSLTLALIGAIVGVGLGLGLSVSWTTVGLVLLAALVALLVSAAAGLLAAKLLGRSPVRQRATTQLRLVGFVSFVLQSVAYAANDGQKMLAVLAIALGLDLQGGLTAGPSVLLAMGLLFALGTLVGIERFAGRLNRRILPLRVRHVVASQLGSSVAVLGSAAVGLPVSMIHASTCALVGAGMSETVRRIRWEQAVRIALAWALTLPAAVICGGLIAVTLRGIL